MTKVGSILVSGKYIRPDNVGVDLDVWYTRWDGGVATEHEQSPNLLGMGDDEP